MYICMYGCMDGCMYGCIFIKLPITEQSGPVIRVIPCHCIDPPKGGSMILVTKTSDMYVCIFIKLHIPAQSGPVIRVILCHTH